MGASLASDSLVAAPALRTVRLGMLVNGAQVGGLLSFSVTNSGYFTADHWSAMIGLQGTPAGYGAPFWSVQQGIEVMLLASLTQGAANLAPVAGGMVDRVEIDIARQVMTIQGRDFTAPLIDNTTNEKFTNQTSSEVATKLAQRRGLTPQVTATRTPIGQYVDSETALVSDDVSEHRLLSYLAQQEGFDFYANGKTLVFGPATQDTNPLVVNYRFGDPKTAALGLNVVGLTLAQNKLLAGTVTVQVRSWSYQTQKPIVATWQAKKTGAVANSAGTTPLTYSRVQSQGGQGSDGPFYVLRRSGLTQQQADQLAQDQLKKITTNEREITATGMPAIIGIDARRTLRLVGTGTAYDQDYAIGEVTREFGWEGATMDITAKSSSPQEVVSL